MIRVIENSTAEKHKETVSIFNQIKLLSDKGYSSTNALSRFIDVPVTNYKNGCFRDLIEYSKNQYDYNELKWKQGQD